MGDLRVCSCDSVGDSEEEETGTGSFGLGVSKERETGWETILAKDWRAAVRPTMPSKGGSRFLTSSPLHLPQLNSRLMNLLVEVTICIFMSNVGLRQSDLVTHTW